MKRLYSYWRRRGVSQLQPSFPFGDFGKVVRQKLLFNEQIDEWYHSIFPTTIDCSRPRIHSQHFNQRFSVFCRSCHSGRWKNALLSGHLFALKGDKWKSLRAKLTPTFTSGKMKAIFTTLLDLKGPLLKHIEQIANSGQSVECYKLASSHTINGIASVAFGIDIDCFADSENPFRKYGLRIDEPSWKNTFRAFCFRLMPTYFIDNVPFTTLECVKCCILLPFALISGGIKT